MNVYEIVELVKSGREVLVEVTKTIEELEGRYEEGMKTYLVEVKEYDDYVIFLTDEKEFVEYNKNLEKSCWSDDYGKIYDLKWSELNRKIIEEDYEIGEELNNKEPVNFKVIKDNSFCLFKEYKESDMSIPYIKFLENKIIELINKN